jgi:hypothetical protein
VIHLAASDAGGARDGVAFDEFTRERGIWLQILDGEGKPLPPTRWSRDKCDRLLADLGATFPIDPDRVVLWGSGDGATLAWDWATARPDRFAAVVWTGGQIARTELSPNLSGLRVVAMCGDGDPAVPRKPWDAWVKTMQRSGVEVTDRRVPDAGRGPISEETKHVMRYLHGAQRQPFVSRLSEGEHLIMDIGAWRMGPFVGGAPAAGDLPASTTIEVLDVRGNIVETRRVWAKPLSVEWKEQRGTLFTGASVPGPIELWFDTTSAPQIDAVQFGSRRVSRRDWATPMWDVLLESTRDPAADYPATTRVILRE